MALAAAGVVLVVASQATPRAPGTEGAPRTRDALQRVAKAARYVGRNGAELRAASRDRIIAISGAMPDPPATSWIGSVWSRCHTNQPPIGPRTSTWSPTA